MRRVRSIATALVAFTLTVSAAQVDISRLGLQVGDHGLDWRLVDQQGRVQTLKTVAGPKGTMLVFFRSADW